MVDTLAQLDDRARDLVSEHGRRREGDLALDHVQIGVADAAGGDPDEDLAAPRLRDRDLLQLERRAGGREHRRQHRPRHVPASLPVECAARPFTHG